MEIAYFDWDKLMELKINKQFKIKKEVIKMASRNKLEKYVNLQVNKKLSDDTFRPKEVNKRGNVFNLVAKTFYNDHNFEIYTHFHYSYETLYFLIYNLTLVGKEKVNICLKILNVCNEFELEGKYALVPHEHLISCTTVHNILQTKHTIVNELISVAECTMDCISYVYEDLENDDPSGFRGKDLQHGYYDL